MKDDVSKRVETLKNKLDLSDRDMIADVPIASKTLSKIKKGLKVGDNFYYRIAAVYNVNPEWLIDGKDVPMFLEPKPKKDVPTVPGDWKDEAYSNLKLEMAELKEKYDRIWEQYEQIWKRLQVYMDRESKDRDEEKKSFQLTLGKSGSRNEAMVIQLPYFYELPRKVAN